MLYEDREAIMAKANARVWEIAKQLIGSASFSAVNGIMEGDREWNMHEAAAVARALMTEREMHNAWRKRGEEAEARENMLRTALEELTGTCEVEFTSDQTDNEPDDEPVGGGLDPDGKPDPMVITFGMIKRARAALTP